MTTPALKMKDVNKMEDSDSIQQGDPLKPSSNTKSDILTVDLADKENTVSKPVTNIPVLVKEHSTNPVGANNLVDRDKDNDGGALKIDERVKLAKDVVKRKKVAGYIADKSLRIRSYVRRRPIPFKRLSELDIQCGTKSFMLQISRDLDEVVYSGSNELAKCFLSPAGIKVSESSQPVRVA